MASWLEEYKSKVVTADEAVRAVKSHQRVFLHGASSTPLILEDALVRRASELEEVEVVHIHSGGKAEYCKPEYKGRFRHNGLFLYGNTRQAVNAGLADFTPVWLSQIPSLFRDGYLPIDVALVQLSPPDKHGYCSFGLSVDVAKPAAESAKVVIAQVNDRFPRTLGDSLIHVSQLTHVVEVSEPPIYHIPTRADGVPAQIAKHVAGLIEDGATLQMGIGDIPDLVLTQLTDRRDLGVHTEVFSDGVMELVNAGVVTNARKTIHRGRVITSFIMGTPELYDFVDNNPMIEMRTTDYVNDPFIISQNANMVAINSALQIDLTGQICPDSLGYQFYSGAGGQADFVIGASRSPGGKAVIALPSTAGGGKYSRIVPALNPGAGVVVTRSQTQFVATEYGVVDLKGKTIRQRVKALIEIAHPEFREGLERFAREQYHI
ncbi:MAG: acetyl-CoA hydrolase/transferase family protein [Chloroflexota bacterium]|jgi:4-hydroxybutyrate CoA-transferase